MTIARRVVGHIRRSTRPVQAEGPTLIIPATPTPSTTEIGNLLPEPGWGHWQPVEIIARVPIARRQAEWRGTPGRPKLPAKAGRR